jgi:hypothetical protein
MKLLLVIFSLILVLIFQVGVCQTIHPKDEYIFMFYNTENFFDCENDSLTNDDEFTPESDRCWNPGRLHAKTERLGKVILAAGKWNPPVCVGLCEVENLKVLELLTGIAPLKKFKYKIVHKDSPDERGIDVALIYRSDMFNPFDYEAINVIDPDDRLFKTREILRVSGVFNECDTFHIFVNHWPSRYGGIMETERYRKLAAETLLKSIQEVKNKFTEAKIICMGDFNDTPNDKSISGILDAQNLDSFLIKGELVNLSAGWQSNPVLTIKNQYTWEIFDQIMVSDFFMQKCSTYQFLDAKIFDAGFVLEPDLKFGGVKPKRTYVGFKYQEGFSDHLPVLLRIRKLNH